MAANQYKGGNNRASFRFGLVSVIRRSVMVENYVGFGSVRLLPEDFDIFFQVNSKLKPKGNITIVFF